MATVSTNDIIINYKIGNPAELEKFANSVAKVTEEEKEAVQELKEFNKEAKKTAETGTKSFDKVGQSVKGASGNMNQFSASLKGVGAAIAAAFAVDRITAFGREVLATYTKFQQLERVLTFTTGSLENSRRTMAQLQLTAQQLGIDLNAAIAGFKTISGAASQAGISSQQTYKIFENVSKAVKTFGLSSEDAQGVFLALGQIISKGTVQAEELRGQIGERIPGAFAIAAKAIGVTEQQLNKMLQQGQVTSRDFVIPFTEALGRMGDAAAGQDGAAEKVNRISNAFEVLKQRIGRGLSDNASQVANLLERALQAANKLLETTTDRDAEITARGYNRALKDAANLSAEALKEQVTMRNAQLRNIQAQFDATNEQAVADGKVTKEEEKQLARLQDQYTFLKGYRDGLFEILEGKKSQVKEEGVNLKLLQDQFNAEKQLLELQREFRRLQGELNNNPNARLAADRTYYAGLEALQIEYKNKGLGIKAEEIRNTRLMEANAAKDLEQDGLKLFMQQKKWQEDLTEVNQKEIDKRVKAVKGELLSNEEATKRMFDILQREKEMQTQAIVDAFALAGNVVNGFTQLQNARLDNQLARLNRNAAEETRLAEGNAQKVQEIELKRAAKEKEIRTKQFRANQQAAIAQVVFDTAAMIAKWSSNPVTLPLAAIALAAQAAQIGFILAQPVPEFAKGVENFEGGPAIVGEQGPELIRTSKGNYLSPGKPTLTYLPKAADVVTAPKTKEILGYNSTYKPGQDRFVEVNVEPIANALSSLPVQSMHVTKRGLEEFVTKGNRTTKILNSRRVK